ncbi:hypothetical protein ACFYT4_21180 [Streptomyces sp. NPDC004609]|uniref:hypothetical protein n=1 Tax=Streptomyces sp. NPDC004609 TaxID=3364704 RepID=UPI0036931CFA
MTARLRNRVRSLAVIGACTALVTVLGPAPAAYAGGCTGSLCSGTANDTAQPVLVARNWCVGGTSTGDTTTTTPVCSSGGVAQEQRWIGGSHRTPQSEDWDTFRVDAGWCYTVEFDGYFWWTDFTRTYNRTSASAVWVKVSNDYTAHIKKQDHGRCT